MCICVVWMQGPVHSLDPHLLGLLDPLPVRASTYTIHSLNRCLLHASMYICVYILYIPYRYVPLHALNILLIDACSMRVRICPWSWRVHHPSTQLLSLATLATYPTFSGPLLWALADSLFLLLCPQGGLCEQFGGHGGVRHGGRTGQLHLPPRYHPQLRHRYPHTHLLKHSISYFIQA